MIQYKMPILFFEPDHRVAQMDGLMKLRRLFGQRVHQVLGQDLGETAHVEDVFFWIEGRELAAKRGQRVHDLRSCATHAPAPEHGEEGPLAPPRR